MPVNLFGDTIEEDAPTNAFGDPVEPTRQRSVNSFGDPVEDEAPAAMPTLAYPESNEPLIASDRRGRFDDQPGASMADLLAGNVQLSDDAVNVGRAFKRGVAGLRQGVSGLALEHATEDVAYEQSLRDRLAAPETPEPIRQEIAQQLTALERRGVGSRAQESLQSSTANIVEMQKAKEAIPATGAVLEFQEGEEWAKALATNPVEVVSSLIAESLPQMAPAMGASLVAGPGAGVAVAGSSSFATEYANGILDSLAKQGMNTSDPDSVKAFFADPEKVATAREFAVKRGVPVAAFDALSAGLAGKILKPFIGQGLGKVAAASAGELAMEGVTGGLGEAGAQLLSEGSVNDPRAIVGEVAAGMGSGPAEVVGNLREELGRPRTPTGTVTPEEMTRWTGDAPPEPLFPADSTLNTTEGGVATADVVPPAPARAVPLDLAPKVAAADMPLTAAAIQAEPAVTPEPVVDTEDDFLTGLESIANEPTTTPQAAEETPATTGQVSPASEADGEEAEGAVPTVGVQPVEEVARRFGSAKEFGASLKNGNADPAPNNKVDEPFSGERFVDGELFIDDYGENPYVYRAEYVDPSIFKKDLKLEGMTYEDVVNLPTTQKYIEWYNEGHEPPPIDVVIKQETNARYSTNRRRVVAALEAGIDRIPARVEIGRRDDIWKAAQKPVEDTPTLTDDEQADWRAMQEEHEAEMRGELDEAPGSYELLEAVRGIGGLPSIETDRSLTGETKRLWEASKGRMMRMVSGKQSLSLDGVRESLEQFGFKFDTAAEMLEALENRIATGREVRGFEPGGGMFASKSEPAFEPRLRSAYDALVKRDRFGFPAVSISALAKESGVPLADLKAKLMALHKQGRVVLSPSDWSLSSPEVRAGMMDVGGQKMTQVRPQDTMASMTPPSNESIMLQRLSAAAEKAKTEAEWDASGKQPGQVEIERPGGGKLFVLNTKEAILKVSDRYRPPSDSSHLQRVADAVEPLKQQISGIRIRVLRNEADLPERIRATLNPRDSHEGLVDTDRGEVYLLSDHIMSPARAKEVFAHEVVGHYGVEKLVGSAEWQKIADSVLREASAAARTVAMSYTKKDSKFRQTGKLSDLTKAERALIAREYVARLAEKPSLAPRTWERIVAAVRRALKKLGIQHEWSEADIRDLLRRAAREVEAPRAAAGAGVMASAKYDTITPAFKKWFGDSKVVGADGNPLIVYHGTAAEFDAFDKSKIGRSDYGTYGRGFYFSETSEDAGTVADGRMKAVYLKVENPIVVGDFWLNEKDSLARTDAAKAAGHDGIKVMMTDEDGNDQPAWWVAFEPEQIKSADRNSGAFDPANPSIYASVKDLGPEVAALAPGAARAEAAFEKAVPEDRREDVGRYVADTLAGRPTVELTTREKNVADRFVRRFQDLDAAAKKAGVGPQAMSAYRAALTANPRMTLPERIATFTAEVEKAKRADVPASPAAPAMSPDADTGGAPVGEPARSTSTKNAVMQAERVQRGDEPIVAEARQSHPDAVARAQREMADNPLRASDAIERLRTSDVRTVSVEDEVVLLVQKVNLMRERTALEERAADPTATPEAQANARKALLDVEKSMNEIDQATYASGAIWGRLGALRRRMMRDDFSLEAVERRVRAQKGDVLTPEESADIKKAVDQVEKAAEALGARETALDDEGARAAAADALAGMERAPQASSAVMALAEKIVSKLERAADAARARIRERLGKASAGVDPTVLYDVAVIGLSKLGRATLDFASWAAEMRADPDLGDWVEPYLNDAWKQTQELWAAEEKKMSSPQREKVRKARTKRTDLLSDRLGIYDGIKAAAKEGATIGEGLDKFVKQLVKNFVDSGTRGLDNVVGRVRETLEPVVPDITPRQIMDAFSDYGKSTPVTSKEADLHRQDIRRQAQLTSAIADVEAGVAPKATGKQRSAPSAAQRALTRLLNEAKRRFNIQPADLGAALRSALDQRKTYFRNRMQDLAFEIARKERVVREKSLSPTDAELDSLKAAYEVVKADHEAVFGKREMTDEQRLQQAVKIAERNEQIATKQLEDAKKGIFPGITGGSKPGINTPALAAVRTRAEAMRAETAELKNHALGLDAARREAALTAKIEDLNGKLMAGDIEAEAAGARVEPSAAAAALKAEYDAMRALLAQLRKDADPRRAPDAVEQRKLVKLNLEIDALDAKIAAGDLSVKARKASKDSNAVEALKSERDAMRKFLGELRAISKRTLITPEERALRAYNTRLAREESDLADRHAKADAGDPTAFAKRVRKPIDISKDPAAVAAKARVDKGKEELRKKEFDYFLKNRSRSRRALDTVLEAMSLGRALNLSADFGFMGLQQGAVLMSNPIMVLKNLPAVIRSAWGSSLTGGKGWERLTGGDGALEAVNAAISLRPNAGLYEQMGIFIGSRNASLSRMEDSFRSRWADQIPLVAHSARAMTAALNMMRADMADMALRDYGLGTQLDAKTLKSMGNFVNIWTGRGAFGKAEQIRGGLNHIFLAPGWVASRFQILYGHSLWEALLNGDAKAAKVFAKQYLRWAAGMAALYTIATLVSGEPPEEDPRSSKFGMLKFGSKLYDFSAATLGPLIFLARAITGKRIENDGDVVNLRRGEGEKKKFGAKSVTDLAFKYVQGKLAPTWGFALDVASGEDIMGRPANWATALLNRTLPLTPRQMTSILMDDGEMSEQAAAALLQFIGINSRDESYNAEQSMETDPVYKIVEQLGVDPR